MLNSKTEEIEMPDSSSTPFDAVIMVNKGFNQDEDNPDGRIQINSQTNEEQPKQRQTSRGYSVVESYRIAQFDSEKVHEHHSKISKRKPLKALVHPKYLKHGWIGYTFNKVLAFLILYYVITIIVAIGTNVNDKKSCGIYKDGEYYKNGTSIFCNLYDKKSGFCKSTKNWKDDHKNMVKVLGFLLGFYTATVMKRWWSQISHMPMITDVTMVLNGIVLPGEKGPYSAMKLKRKLLRYCLLSWTLLMSKISPILKAKYANDADPNELLAKGLITPQEVKILTRNDNTSMAWLDKWWMPMNWCMLLINKELHESGHLPRQGKVVLYELKNYKKSLEGVMEYNHHPLPAICAQAVHVVCWFYLIVGAFSSQPWCSNDNDSAWHYFQRLPINTSVLVALMFAWLKMSEICTSPFDGDKHYDIDLVEELDIEIWKASVALQESADDELLLSDNELPKIGQD